MHLTKERNHMTSMDISSTTHMLPAHLETCPVAWACQPGPQTPAWLFQDACKCGPGLLPPLGVSMSPRHQEDGGQPGPGHFMYLVYPMSQHILLHALTIPCMSPDPMDTGQALRKSPGSCSLHKVMIKVISLTYFTSLQRHSMLVLLCWLGREVC